MKTPLCTMSKSQTTSASNCKVIRDGEAGRRGACWLKVTFTLEFLALKGLTAKAVKNQECGMSMTPNMFS